MNSIGFGFLVVTSYYMHVIVHSSSVYVCLCVSFFLIKQSHHYSVWLYHLRKVNSVATGC